MRLCASISIAGLLAGFAVNALAQEAVPAPPQTEQEKAALLDLVLKNQKRSDEAMNVYERIERVESRKNSGDPTETKISRVIPAGTGVDHIPIGPDGKPADPDAYHRDLIKLEKSLSWAADDGHAQRDAYDKMAKKQRERDELIDATRIAFIYTLVGTETRGDGRTLYKYSLEPNPAFKPTSRGTAIFAKVRGFVWIDPVAGELARIEGEVTGDINVGIFLAKIYKGSRFMQDRYEMAPGVWLPTFSQYDFDGRKFLSPIYIHEKTFYRDYRRIGPPKEALASIRAELDKSEAPVSDP